MLTFNALPSSASRPLRHAAFAGAAALLAACAQTQPSEPIGTAPAPVETGRAVDVSGPVQAALLLPQSTSDPYTQAEAADILQAARIAERESGGLINLEVYDTGGTEAGAVAAARRAAASGAGVILGPLRRDTTRAIRPVAEEADISVLSFSSDSTVGDPPVWLLGDLPENEVDRILGYAASQGIGRVALVRPQDDYGQVVERSLRQAAPRYGVAVTGVLPYERSSAGVQRDISAGAAALRAGSPEAVLIAEGDLPLREVASWLAYNNLMQPRTQYLGTAFWDTPEAPKEPLLHGGWFAAPDPTASERFAEAFTQATGQAPGARAALGYDAVKAAAALVREARAGGQSSPFSAEAIARAGAFEGAGGPFLITPEGGNRRALTVYEVTAEGFEPLDTGRIAAGS